MTGAVEAAAEALLSGEVAIVPTDTVYGLAASPSSSESVRRLYELKGRDASQPTALVASSVDLLCDCVPELRGLADRALQALLPGALTLVVPNPAQRFAWLCGDRPDAIGVRVPSLEGVGRDLLNRIGAYAATSANRPGGVDPRSVADVPLELRTAAAAVLDGGVLPGVPSTVLDLTGREPRVLREGAVPAAEVLARLG